MATVSGPGRRSPPTSTPTTASGRSATRASTAGPGATLLLNFEARDVYLVLGGTGYVAVSVDGRRPGR